MRIKKVVKRLIALSAGATMLGATVMGAMAADLSSFPDSFHDEGVFNGYFVVGEAAKPIDNLAMTDIATSMWWTKPADAALVTVEGDAWAVGTSADWLEVNESIGPSGAGGIVDYISADELAALADGELSNSKGTFNYEQKLYFENAVGTQGRAWFMENDDDEIGLFWKITDGDQIAMYELDFTTDAESDIDASDSNALKDFEDKKLTFMGTEWTMTTAKYTSSADGVELVFMGGAISGTIDEGETQTYIVNGKDYEVSLDYTSTTQVAFTVNGEYTAKLEDGETTILADGTTFGVSDILYQEYAGGVHQASFFLGANKLELTDTTINDTTSSNELKVNEETIDGANVYIVGTIPTQPSGTTTDGEIKIDYLRVNMTAQDDIYMAAGEKLSEDSELVEPALLFTQNWDFEFHGTATDVEENMVYLRKSGDDKYEVKFTSNDGNEVTLPLMFASANNQVQLGEKSGDNLAMDILVNITDDDYFVLANKETDTPGNSDAVVTILQYQSSKNSGDDTQIIKFKNINTGEVLERTFTDDCTFDISIEGRTHSFDGVDVCTSDNWDIKLTSADYAYDAVSENVSHLNLRDASGAKIDIYTTESGVDISTPDSVLVTNTVGLNLLVSYDDTDRLDDHTAAAETVVLYNLTETDVQEVTGTAITDPAWTVQDPDDTDVQWGYSNTGLLVKETTASNTPLELDITVPSRSREVLAYITSGATTTTVVTGGELALVQVVDATKLDTEVADVSAQNLVVVGGPCVNSVAAELLGNPADCTEGFSPGKARLKMFDSGAGNLAMLVAGYSGEDTRLAGKVIAHRADELSGEEMEVAGTTWSDATLEVPTVVEEVVEEMVEEVVEE